MKNPSFKKKRCILWICFSRRKLQPSGKEDSEKSIWPCRIEMRCTAEPALATPESPKSLPLLDINRIGSPRTVELRGAPSLGDRFESRMVTQEE